MRRLTQFLKRIVSGRRAEDLPPEALQRLRAEFKERYHNFKLLLTANNNALEIMSDFEQALSGGAPFGLAFIKHKSTAICVNVFKMVKYLDELAPQKYVELFERFKVIQTSINDAVASKKVMDDGPLVVPLSQVDANMADHVGGKMAHLAELRNRLAMPVPGGFVITSRAFDRFLEHNDLKTEIDRRIQAAGTEKIDDLYSLSADLQQLIIRSPLPDDVEESILEAYRALEKEAGEGVRVSLRSSALGEDAAGTAFAGQFRSELNVAPEHMMQAYKEVVAAKYGLPAITYRLSRGIPDEVVAMSVGCMAMVDAAAGGVIYTRNPLNIRDRSIFINSVWGLPKAVVDGSIETDLIVVSRDDPPQITEKDIKTKETQFVCYPDEGVCRMELTGEKSSSQSITDAQALALASMAIRLEEYYGAPQDIEWAIANDGSIYLLQCRHLQQWGPGDKRIERPDPKTLLAPAKVTGGVTASPGVGSGPVFIVHNEADKLRFPEGAVLVAVQALPAWAPLLSRCAAVIIEIGGVAGHLANVAREFEVPALFAVPRATELLNSGDLVTVDADGLTVYQGRVEELLSLKETRRNLMQGSPVYKILEHVAAKVIPLNLLDPDAPAFHPAKCETLHDITRFIHEKSVHEMFEFGRKHRFSERSSKQLVCNVPMQWWIINLDDGFNHDVDGRFVHIDNIASVPMLALWQGVTAVQWEGPPPVDAKGFMEVMVQATVNPALDPAVRSAYAVRNYFMISKNFCSLFSRFGFHFSTAEALVSERPAENYIGFSFKGGAADRTRRVKRAVLIAEILQSLGFRADVKDDGVFARVEGFDEEYMKSRLVILGYLIMHTRQLDMIMADNSSIANYRAKFLRDIENLLPCPPSVEPAQA